MLASSPNRSVIGSVEPHQTSWRSAGPDPKQKLHNCHPIYLVGHKTQISRCFSATIFANGLFVILRGTALHPPCCVFVSNISARSSSLPVRRRALWFHSAKTMLAGPATATTTPHGSPPTNQPTSRWTIGLEWILAEVETGQRVAD